MTPKGRKGIEKQMPCYTVQSSTIDMRKADPQILADALTAMGFYSVDVYADGRVSAYSPAGAASFADGTLSLPTSYAAQMAQQYGKAVVRAATAKFGWRANEQANGKIKVQRRY